MALFTSTGIETENLLVEERPVSGISSSPLCAITSLAVYFLHSTWPSATWLDSRTSIAASDWKKWCQRHNAPCVNWPPTSGKIWGRFLVRSVQASGIGTTLIDSKDKSGNYASRGGIFMVALCNRADHYIFALWFLSFFLLSFFLSFISSPNLSSRRLDVYHTSTHGVALVRI